MSQSNNQLRQAVKSVRRRHDHLVSRINSVDGGRINPSVSFDCREASSISIVLCRLLDHYAEDSDMAEIIDTKTLFSLTRSFKNTKEAK